MATVTRLYEVVLQATYAGQEIVNRWNYLGTGDDAVAIPSVGLITELGAAETGVEFADGSIFRHIQALQVADLVYHQCLCRSVYAPTDFIDVPFPTPKPGALTGTDGESPFVAFGFRSNRVRTDIGRGYKRFAGVPENLVDNLGIINSTLLSAMTILAGNMSDTLSHTFGSNVWNFVPCVVGKEKIVSPPDPVKYRYYATESEQASHLATGITFEPYDTVRSQVSRQYNKGK